MMPMLRFHIAQQLVDLLGQYALMLSSACKCPLHLHSGRTPSGSSAGLTSSYDRVMAHPAKLLSKLKIGSKRSTKASPAAPAPLHPHNNLSAQLPSSGSATPKEGSSAADGLHQGPASSPGNTVSAFEANPTVAVAAADAASNRIGCKGSNPTLHHGSSGGRGCQPLPEEALDWQAGCPDRLCQCCL
eukprot:scaffold118809_cov21-Tisochrysis_lutea.AAC.1